MEQAESDILRHIYAAPLDPASLEQALDLLAVHFDCVYCMLAVASRRGDEATWTTMSENIRRIIQERGEDYAAHMRTFDAYYSRTIARAAAQAPLNLIDSRDFAWSQDEVELEERVSEDCEGTVGHYHRIGGAFGIHSQRLGFLGLGLTRDADPKAFLADPTRGLWLQHFEQADVHAAAFASLRTRFGAVLAVLDKLLLGIVIIDAAGNALVVNETARSIFDAQGVLAIQDGRILGPPEFSAALKPMLSHRQALKAASIGMIRSFGPADDPERYVCLADPLQVPADEFDQPVAGAVLVLIDTRASRISNIELSATLLDLTQAEAECLDLLIAGDTYNVISEKRNVSRETTKSHVSSILRKAGVQRVPQLILKVAKIDPPYDFS